MSNHERFPIPPPPTDADRERWRREAAQARAWREAVKGGGHLTAPGADEELDEPQPAGPLPGQLEFQL